MHLTFILSRYKLLSMASFCSDFIYIWLCLFKALKKNHVIMKLRVCIHDRVSTLLRLIQRAECPGWVSIIWKALGDNRGQGIGQGPEWQHNQFGWGNGLSGRIIYNVIKLSQGLSAFVFYVGSRETHGWIYCPWLEEISYFPLYPWWLSFQANFWHEISPHCLSKSCPNVTFCRD